MLGNSKLSPSLRESHPESNNSFKDSYVFEFLNLSESHSESDLQNGLIKQLKNFILELGKDFLFIGKEYKVQVGKSDFYIDLLFYHRGLQCLVAVAVYRRTGQFTYDRKVLKVPVVDTRKLYLMFCS